MPLGAVHIQAQHGHAQAIPREQALGLTYEKPDCMTFFTELLVYRTVDVLQARFLGLEYQAFLKVAAAF